jgi:hypothetical protein
MIGHLTVTHLLGVQRFKADLGPCTLFCGANAAGKSSLLHAIAFALTGALPRGVLKKDARVVVAEGQKSGAVEVIFSDGTALERRLPTGDVVGELPASYQANPLPLVLDAGGFAALDMTKRRKLLFDTTGVEASKEWVAERLAEEKIPERIIEQTLPLLRTGFDDAMTRAAAKTSEATGEWRGITGEAYGSKKAEGWQAEVPENPGHDLVALETARDRAETDMATLRERLGRLKSRGALGAVPTPEDIDAKAKKVETAEKKLTTLETEQRTLQAAADAGNGTECACPACGAALLIDRGTVRAAPPRIEGKHPAQAQTEAKDLAKRIDDGRTKVREAKTELEKMRAIRTAAAALGGEDNGETVEQVEQELDVLAQAAHLARMQLQTQRDADRAREEATGRTERAARAHQDALAWDRTAKLLAPAGLPAELLVRALEPFRACLRDGPQDWPPITLGDDMEIRIAGRAYALCSESERWRADAVVSTALARLGGVPLVLLDRLDVLEPAARGDALAWLRWIAEEFGVQVIAAATLKSCPSIDGVTAHWIGEERKAA